MYNIPFVITPYLADAIRVLDRVNGCLPLHIPYLEVVVSVEVKLWDTTCFLVQESSNSRVRSRVCLQG